MNLTALAAAAVMALAEATDRTPADALRSIEQTSVGWGRPDHGR
ncbi:hypothetical protein [Amycolatopsis sp. cmx-8-4]